MLVSVRLNHCGACSLPYTPVGILRSTLVCDWLPASRRMWGESVDGGDPLNPSPRIWVRVPRGPIPEVVQRTLQARLERPAQTVWRDRCRAVLIRFRGAYAYVDALPSDQEALLEGGTGKKGTPVRLCRLGYLGNVNQGQYAFFKYSDMKYALSLVAARSFEATPAEAFDGSAGVYRVAESERHPAR